MKMNDSKQDPKMFWVKQDRKDWEKEDIPCIECGGKGLEVRRDNNGNDCLWCEDCRVVTHWVITELHEDQKIDINKEGLYEAVIDKKCRKCREHLEFYGRNCWERFKDRNQWSCPNGCTRKKEFKDFEVVKIKSGKIKESVFDVVPSKSIPV